MKWFINKTNQIPMPISPNKLLILTQQITEQFQLSQEACNQLCSQMNEMVKTKKVQGTYKRLTNV